MRLCDPRNGFQDFFPDVLTPADLSYHSRFPRYRHVTFLFVTDEELGILEVVFRNCKSANFKFNGSSKGSFKTGAAVG